MVGLLSELTVNGIRLNTRIVLPPMEARKAGEAGAVTDELIEHYTRRAGQELGLIISEHTYIERRGQAAPRQLGVYDDKLIPGHKRFAAAIKEKGSIAVV